jgi:nitrogen fixation protein FixH
MRTLIILVSILAIAATIGTVVVGRHSFEGIVVDKPYETGLAWDAIQQNRENLAWKAAVRQRTFKTGRNDLTITVLGKDGLPLANALVRVNISRPSTGAFDRTFQTVQQADGSYQAAIDLPLYGNWDLNIDVSRETDSTSFKKSIFAEGAPK